MSAEGNRRILLVYPPYEKPLMRQGLHYTSIPLGVGYLASVLEASGFEVSVVDCNIRESSPEGMAESIGELKPDIVGLTITSPGLRYAYKLISELREGGLTSTIRVAAGGPHVTADPGASTCLGADLYFTGESEYAFRDYCVSRRENAGRNNIIESGLIGDLDCLPYPARHLFNGGSYRFTPVAASRGCPFNCGYCGISGTQYRKRSIANVRGEIEHLASFNTRSVDFTDDIFTLDRPYARGVAEVMGEYGMGWSCTTRADLVDGGILEHLADNECRHISFGVETGVERIRYRMGKKVPDSRYQNAFKSCRDAGIRTRAYAMLGFPGETLEDVHRTFDFVNGLGADEVLYSPTIIYPNTWLMKAAVEEGKTGSDAWVRYMRGEGGIPYYLPEGLSLEEVNALIYEEGKRFYLNPKRILARMRDAQSLDDIADSFKALAVWMVGAINKQTRTK
ncbi:MAG: radical SAM protein [Candidatus Altiarchaeales archaeon]|nr:radical SAM protein [Candidatus Altiarchaeales archaeon]